jgi:hypothetical protein
MQRQILKEQVIIKELETRGSIIEVLVAQGFNHQTLGEKWLLGSR